MRTLNKIVSLVFLMTATMVMVAFASAAQSADIAAETKAMKAESRGPFSRLRWFCADGSVLPAKPYARADQGGGVQHGKYSAKTQKIRYAGNPIATLLADPEPADQLQKEKGENFPEQDLVGFDNGWLIRKARFYHVAIRVKR